MKTNSIDPGDGILIIDDHAISRQFTIEALRPFSNNIRQAHTGHQAIATVRSWYPGLIFTDIHLPDISGFTVIQKVKSVCPRGRNQPHVVIITGDCSSRLRQRAKQANVAGVLLKPVRLEDIRACVRRLLYLGNSVQETLELAPAAANEHELRKLFSRELATQLPKLDGYVSQLDWKPASEILHQLIASSAMCREKELENCSRLLYQAISGNLGPKTIAQAYHPFLRAAAHTKMHL